MKCLEGGAYDCCFLFPVACRSGNSTNIDSTDSETDTDADSRMNADADTDNDFPECPRASRLNCGVQTSGTTINERSNKWSVDNCSAHAMSGPESLYFFVPDDNCEVEARLTNISVNLNLFQIPDCDLPQFDANTTSRSVTPDQDDAIGTFTAVAGVPLFLVVDGCDNATGTFSLALDCTSDEPMATDTIRL